MAPAVFPIVANKTKTVDIESEVGKEGGDGGCGGEREEGRAVGGGWAAKEGQNVHKSKTTRTIRSCRSSIIDDGDSQRKCNAHKQAPGEEGQELVGTGTESGPGSRQGVAEVNHSEENDGRRP